MSPEKYGKKRLQVSFRISDLAETRLQERADLFGLAPTQYAKAVLYKDLGVFGEPLDRRRRSFQRRRRAEEEELEHW